MAPSCKRPGARSPGRSPVAHTPGTRHFGSRSVSHVHEPRRAEGRARRAEQLLREERRAKRKARMVHRSTHLVVALGGSVTAYCVVRILLGRLAHPPRSRMNAPRKPTRVCHLRPHIHLRQGAGHWPADRQDRPRRPARLAGHRGPQGRRPERFEDPTPRTRCDAGRCPGRSLRRGGGLQARPARSEHVAPAPYLDLFKGWGVGFASARDPGIDTTTPQGRLLLHLLASFAEFEQELARERIIAGVRRAQAKGTHCGRPKVGSTSGLRWRC